MLPREALWSLREIEDPACFSIQELVATHCGVVFAGLHIDTAGARRRYDVTAPADTHSRRVVDGPAATGNRRWRGVDGVAQWRPVPHDDDLDAFLAPAFIVVEVRNNSG